MLVVHDQNYVSPCSVLGCHFGEEFFLKFVWIVDEVNYWVPPSSLILWPGHGESVEVDVEAMVDDEGAGIEAHSPGYLVSLPDVFEDRAA